MNNEYTHIPTRLQSVEPKCDRAVRFNNDTIARVYENRIRPGGPQWNYHAQWVCKGGFNGDADTLQEALSIIKEAHIQAGQPPSVAASKFGVGGR